MCFCDLFVSFKILRVFCICVGLLVSRYDFSLIVRWLLSFFPVFSFILLNVSYIVQQRSKNLDSKSWMSFRVNLFVFYWTDDFAGSWKFSENFRGYFAARVPAHLAVVPSWTTSGTLRSQFFARNYSLKKWIDKYGFCNVYIHTINMSWLKEREWTSVCLVVFYRIIEKLQKTTTDYITHHVEQDYPKRIGNTRKWLIWLSARQKMHSTKVYSINIASGRQWHNMVSFAVLHQTSINVKIQMEV